MLTDLIRPFAYLTIEHPSRLPRRVNWHLPLALTLLITWGVVGGDLPINFFGDKGVLDRLLAFVQTLVGFYIAALAAVASFNSPHLDKIMPLPAPTMVINYGGGRQEVKATRRRFLSSMFAYLTALSFLFSISAIVVLSVGSAVATVFSSSLVQALKVVLMFCFTFGIVQLICITFWGLYYLGERMLTPD